MISGSRTQKRTYLFWLVLIFIISSLWSCTAYRSKYIGERGVYYFQRVRLGDVRQSVKVRGEDKNNPVMIYLHGGPGFPLFPVDQTNGVMRELEKHFTMVYWEQRGTGGSFSWRLPKKSLSVQCFVDDTKELVEYLQDLLDVEKVFLWGHSWGSSFGAIFASQHPGMLHAYISTGQSVHPFINERLNYEFVLSKATEDNNIRALRQIERVDTIPENYTLRDALLVRRWVAYYGGVEKEPERGRYIDAGYILSTLRATQYGLIDKLNMVLMPYFSADELWNDLMTLDLTKQAPRIEVPVFFMTGRYDVIVSAVLAEQYFELLEAPAGKQLIWFEQSAHRPHHEEKEKFLRKMRTLVLPVASR